MRRSEKPYSLARRNSLSRSLKRATADLPLQFGKLRDLVEKPGVNMGQAVDFFDRPADIERVDYIMQPILVRCGEGSVQLLARHFARAERFDRFERTQRLEKRFLECPADRHHLADRFHLNAERGIGTGKFLESEFGNLGDDIINRRFECGGSLAGDVVGDFIESVADRQLGGDFGDRKTGGFGSQRRGSRNARDSFRSRPVGRCAD